MSGTSVRWKGILFACSGLCVGLILFPAIVWFGCGLAEASISEVAVWVSVGLMPLIAGLVAIQKKRRIALTPEAKQRLPRGALTTLTVCAMWFIACAAVCVRPTSSLVFGTMLLTLPLVFFTMRSFVWIFKQWKTFRLRSLLPFVTCLAVLFSARPVGWLIHSALFKHRFPQYLALVQKIQSGAILVTTERKRISNSEFGPSLANFAFAWRDTNGALTVEFVYGMAGPPPRHSAYVYRESGVIESDRHLDEHWPFRKKLREQWFDVND